MFNQNIVWFLGFSSINEGLIFPNEISQNTEIDEYCPSAFVIIASPNPKDSLLQSYAIDVYMNGSVRELYLEQRDITKTGSSNLYYMNTRYGEVDFEFKKIKYKYIGDFSLLQGAVLYQMMPIQVPKLEEWAIRHDFFIVGRTP